MAGNAPALTDERDLLLAYLEQQRAGLRNAAFGLTDEQARLQPTAGTLSIGGLVKHVAANERYWVGLALQRPEESAEAQQSAYEDAFTLLEHETLAGALADLDEAARETADAIRSLPLDAPVPVPQDVPWFPKDVEAWSVRWVLLHLIEEVARHAGHADIVRESIDGATMYELMAGVEGWPETPWLKPWRPATAGV